MSTLLIARELDYPSTAFMSGVILLGTPVLWLNATQLQVDIGFAAAQTFGFAAYLRGNRLRGLGGWGWRALGFAGFGLAILGKGPLGILLPGLVLSCWHCWNREWFRILSLGPLALVSLLVAAPWYFSLTQRLGTDFVVNELYLQNFDRFQAANRGHGGKGLHYYIKSLLVDFLPWSFLVVPALWHGFKQRRNEKSWRLLAAWILAPLIFFTLASTKRNVYLLPIYPPLAMLVAGWLGSSLSVGQARFQRQVALGWSGILAIVGGLLLVAGMIWPALIIHFSTGRLSLDQLRALRPGLLVIGPTLLVSSSIAIISAKRASSWVLPLLSATGALLWSMAMALVLPVIDQQRSYAPAAKWLVEQAKPNHVIGYYWPGRDASKRPAWLCHLEGRRLIFFNSPLEARMWLAADTKRIVLTTPPLVQELNPVSVEALWKISSTDWAVVRGDGAREEDMFHGQP
jgi:4-amino-4-deoxy-L-arabinose transferase-like glycosyltransferase